MKYFFMIFFLISVPVTHVFCEIEVGNGSSGIALALENARNVLVYILNEKREFTFETEDQPYQEFLLKHKIALLDALSKMEFEPKLPQDFNAIDGCQGRDLCIVEKDTKNEVYFRSDAFYLVMVGLNHLFARLLHEAAHTVKEPIPHAFLDKFGLSVAKSILMSCQDDKKIMFAQTLYEDINPECVSNFALWLEFQESLQTVWEKKEEVTNQYKALKSIKLSSFNDISTLKELEKKAQTYALQKIISESWYLNGISAIHINLHQLISIIFLSPPHSDFQHQLIFIFRNTLDDLCLWSLTGNTVWAEGYNNGFWSSHHFEQEWPIENISIFHKEDFKNLLKQIEGEQQ